MAKELLVGKNGNKRTTDFFTWLNGLKYRVIEGYTWKNGLCYQFYGAGGSGYSGLRLAFDYDYEVGQTYTKNTENIIDVADYIIEKNALVTYSTGGATLTQAVKSKKSEILAYISGLLISTDDTAIINYSCSFGSSYAGGGLCQINLYIGHSNLNSLTVSNLYYNSFYPRVDWNRSSDGRTRLQISVSCYANGTLTKSSRSSTRSVGEVIGQFTQTQSYTYNFDYIYFLSNIGTHIESFSSGNIIANFDYTRSYNDTVDGINGYLNKSTSTRDSQGLHKTDLLGIQLPQWLLHYGNAVEVSIGTTSYDTSSSYVPSLIAFRGAVNGQIFLEYLQDRNTWSFVRNTSYYDLNISDFHYFDNSTVKMSYSLSDGKVALYKNNTLVYQSSLVFDPTIQESSIIVMNNTMGLVKTLRVLKEEDIRSIYSALYSNANVSNAGIISTNNGSRTPTSKHANGDAVAFCVRNGGGTGYGGNWMVTVCVALTEDAARLDATDTGSSVDNHTINGVTYYVSQQGSNSTWGGATEISSPIGLPIFDDWRVFSPAVSPAVNQQQLMDIIQTLDIRVQ